MVTSLWPRFFGLPCTISAKLYPEMPMGLWPHFLARPVQRRNQKSNQGRTTPRGPRGGQTEQLEQREIAGAYESSSTCSSFVGRSVGELR